MHNILSKNFKEQMLTGGGVSIFTDIYDNQRLISMTHNSLPLNCILCQFNPIYITHSPFLKNRFNIILPDEKYECWCYLFINCPWPTMLDDLKMYKHNYTISERMPALFSIV